MDTVDKIKQLTIIASEDAEFGNKLNEAVDARDPKAIVALAQEKGIDLTLADITPADPAPSGQELDDESSKRLQAAPRPVTRYSSAAATWMPSSAASTSSLPSGLAQATSKQRPRSVLPSDEKIQASRVGEAPVCTARHAVTYGELLFEARDGRPRALRRQLGLQLVPDVCNRAGDCFGPPRKGRRRGVRAQSRHRPGTTLPLLPKPLCSGGPLVPYGKVQLPLPSLLYISPLRGISSFSQAFAAKTCPRPCRASRTA